jgi:hypothetical protein
MIAQKTMQKIMLTLPCFNSNGDVAQLCYIEADLHEFETRFKNNFPKEASAFVQYIENTLPEGIKLNNIQVPESPEFTYTGSDEPVMPIFKPAYKLGDSQEQRNSQPPTQNLHSQLPTQKLPHQQNSQPPTQKLPSEVPLRLQTPPSLPREVRLHVHTDSPVYRMQTPPLDYSFVVQSPLPNQASPKQLKVHKCFEYMVKTFGFCFVGHENVYLLARRHEGEFCYTLFKNSKASPYEPIFTAMINLLCSSALHNKKVKQ